MFLEAKSKRRDKFIKVSLVGTGFPESRRNTVFCVLCQRKRKLGGICGLVRWSASSGSQVVPRLHLSLSAIRPSVDELGRKHEFRFLPYFLDLD